MADNNDPGGADDNPPATERDLEDGLRFVHNALGSSLADAGTLQAQLDGLTELLLAKGILKLREVEDKRKEVEAQLGERVGPDWEGARVLSDETDKYQEKPVDIDCAPRVHLCKAACCKLGFFLSNQDLEEGVVKWEFGRPYLIRSRDSGYCYHNDDATRACNVHAHRPLPCRRYDCRKDARIWSDFEGMVPSPDLKDL